MFFHLFITDINNYIIKMYLSEQLLVGLKLIVNPKILSLFTHHHDIPILYGFLFSVQHYIYSIYIHNINVCVLVHSMGSNVDGKLPV